MRCVSSSRVRLVLGLLFLLTMAIATGAQIGVVVLPSHIRVYSVPASSRTIRELMADARMSCRDQQVAERVSEIRSKWFSRGGSADLASDLRALGPSAVPFIEPYTRSRDAGRREDALMMLSWLIRPDGPPNEPMHDPMARHRWMRKYIGPIMLRSFGDASPVARAIPVREAGSVFAPDRSKLPMFREMLSDPSSGVRMAAALVIAGGYHRADMLSWWLRRAVEQCPRE